MSCETCKAEGKKGILVRRGGKVVAFRCRDCVKERQQNYSKTPTGKLAVNRAEAVRYKKHKHKVLARLKARYAVKKGILVKPKWCEVCNLVKPLQGHHEDYSKPLEVIWLCTGCHADADRELELNSAAPITP